jgi:hypothetical protein
MRSIPLTQGRFALVSDEDFLVLSQWTWCVSGNGYAHRSVNINGRKSTVKMHRTVIHAPKGFDIDHINGNKLDNRRENLRIASRSLNMHNVPKRVTNTSGYKGVTWHKAANKWCAQIMINYKNHYLGLFENIEEAVRARRKKEVDLL